MSDDASEDDAAEASEGLAEPAVVLDYFPTGRPDESRRGYEGAPLVLALGVEDFRLVECPLSEELDLGVGDRIDLGHEAIERVSEVDHDDLSGNARSELEYAVESIVEADEERFVAHFNEAQPITLRLHQLNLLPGIGKKLRNAILEERKRKPFESFEELEERVSGLHDPEGVLVERVLEELREEDLKYRSFVRRPEE